MILLLQIHQMLLLCYAPALLSLKNEVCVSAHSFSPFVLYLLIIIQQMINIVTLFLLFCHTVTNLFNCFHVSDP